ncbi:hypothetical protein MTO96_004522 [Rhipicephalus appendiculatus]
MNWTGCAPLRKDAIIIGSVFGSCPGVGTSHALEASSSSSVAAVVRPVLHAMPMTKRPETVRLQPFSFENPR